MHLRGLSHLAVNAGIRAYLGRNVVDSQALSQAPRGNGPKRVSDVACCHDSPLQSELPALERARPTPETATVDASIHAPGRGGRRRPHARGADTRPGRGALVRAERDSLVRREQEAARRRAEAEALAAGLAARSRLWCRHPYRSSPRLPPGPGESVRTPPQPAPRSGRFWIRGQACPLGCWLGWRQRWPPSGCSTRG